LKRGNFDTENKRNGLPAFAKKWPTPSASDNRDRGNLSSPAIKRRLEKGKQAMLSMVVSETSGQLNPTWVEWLMGFPLGWTDLPNWVTRSSRKSQK
jgi:DNA (cytosine-5)-methyltransferase 1